MSTSLDNRQSRQRSALDQLSNSTDLRLDTILNLVNDELTMPLRLKADTTPSLRLNIGAIQIQTIDGAVGTGRKRTIQPINNLIPSFTPGYLTFPSTSGGSITASGFSLQSAYTLTVSSGNYIKVVVALNSLGQVVLTFGTEGGSESTAALPSVLSGTLGLGYVVLTNSGGTIQNVLDSNIYQFMGGGGGGGSGASAKQVTQNSHGFTVGQVIYLNGSTYALAKADLANTAEAIGVVSNIINSNIFEVTELGYISGLSGLTAGTVYFLSNTTAGLLTATEPTTIGAISKPMLIADSTTSGYVLNYRGATIGGTNVRSQVGLVNNASTPVQLVTSYEAGELVGWVDLQNSTAANSKKFYIQVQFAKNGPATDYNVAYQTSGDTPPAGFAVVYSANYIRITLPNISGFTTASINYALNAPAVGTTFPLTIDGSTSISTANGLTIQQIATPSNPVSGFNKIYTKSDGLLYKLDSAGNEVAVGSGASGSGEINAVLNPSAATDTTGWAAGTSHTVAKDAANSPLSGIVSTSFAISSSAAVALGSQTSTSGVYDAITLPSGLQNRKLKVEFFFTTPASSAGTWAVALYQGSTKLTLSTDSSGDTILPAGVTGGKFTAYFDSSSSSGYSLNLVQRTRTSANTLYITNVIVGPGIQPQGAVVGEWVSFSSNPTATSFGTTTNTNWKYRRVGESAEIRGVFQTGTVAAAVADITLPSGFTIDLTKVTATSANRGRLGRYEAGNATAISISSNNNEGVLFSDGSTNNKVFFAVQSDASGYVKNNGNSITGNTQYIMLEFTAPIAEWAGSGTLTVAQNDVEYAYSTNTVTTAGNTQADDGLYGYGPNGTQFVSIDSATLNSNTKKRVRFQTPIQATDIIKLEFWDTNRWYEVGVEGTLAAQLRIDNTAQFGAGIEPVSGSNTDIYVLFGNSGRISGATYGAVSAGAVWSNISGSANYKWRVRKQSAGAAVGFGIVSPGVSSGLVSAAGLPGNTTGNAIASGYVGETTIFSVAGTTTANTFSTSSAQTISKGIYLVTIYVYSAGTAGLTFAGGGVSTDSGATTFTDLSMNSATPNFIQTVASGANGDVTISTAYPLTVNATTTYYAKVRTVGGGTNARTSISFIRIA